MIEVDKKYCTRCQQWKSLRSFNNDDARPDGKYPWCRACRARYMRELSAKSHRSDDITRVCDACKVGIGGAHPNVRYCSQKCKSKAGLARMYGLTIDEYNGVIAAQGGKCPLCKKNVRKWCMDHNHETGETFGPICNQCNTKLVAWSFHDVEIAERLVQYLTDPPVRTMFGPKFVTVKKVAQSTNSAKYSDAGTYPHGLKRGGKVVKRSKRKR